MKIVGYTLRSKRLDSLDQAASMSGNQIWWVDLMGDDEAQNSAEKEVELLQCLAVEPEVVALYASKLPKAG